MTRLVRRFAALTALSFGLLQVVPTSAQAPVRKPAPKGAAPAKAEPPQPAESPIGAAVPGKPAPTAQQKVRARELYTKGQQMFRQGDYGGAQRSFEQAYAAVPNPVVLLSVAECQVRSEQYAAAVVTLQQYLDERKEAPDRAQVEAQITKIKEKPARLTVESTPAGAIIFVDGQDTGKLTPADVEVAAGDHMIAVQIEGFQRAEQAVSLFIGGHDSVRFALPEVAPKLAESTPAKTRDQTDGGGKNELLPVWIATGLAGAGVVTGAMLGGFAIKQSNDFKDHPTEATADKGERLALFADVGFGIAAAAGVTAVILYFTRHKSTAPEAQAFNVSPALTRSELGVTGNLRF
jgi:hypothetical protein